VYSQLKTNRAVL